MKKLIKILFQLGVPAIHDRVIWSAKQGIYANPNGITEEDLIWYIAKTYSLSGILIKIVTKLCLLIPTIWSLSLIDAFPTSIKYFIGMWFSCVVLFVFVVLITHVNFLFSDLEEKKQEIEDSLKNYSHDYFMLESSRILVDEWDRIKDKRYLKNLYGK
ncbi:hypothetical protein [Bacillus mycoides]|uniref:hypothetical protein n=1 Tax=Bacillus mycoides TaxID=1405 RepID=UPI00366C4F0A